MQNSDLMSQLNNFKEEYYNKNSKNIFFKKSQKMECAEHISNNFNILELLRLTAFIIPNTNFIFIDYLIFKMYANESNYDIIVDYIMQLFDSCINKYGDFVVHVNLDTFSVSAAERYKNIIIKFNKKCIENLNTEYSKKLNYWKIYNTPNVIETIKKILKTVIEPEVINKINLVSKKDSDAELKNLFSIK
jgi:hypothetical protein